jgi:hypothetical protein
MQLVATSTIAPSNIAIGSPSKLGIPLAIHTNDVIDNTSIQNVCKVMIDKKN